MAWEGLLANRGREDGAIDLTTGERRGAKPAFPPVSSNSPNCTVVVPLDLYIHYIQHINSPQQEEINITTRQCERPAGQK